MPFTLTLAEYTLAGKRWPCQLPRRPLYWNGFRDIGTSEARGTPNWSDSNSRMVGVSGLVSQGHAGPFAFQAWGTDDSCPGEVSSFGVYDL